MIRYLEIENFKSFSDNIHIDIRFPQTITGGNDTGKTNILQALMLWSKGVRLWYDRRINPSVAAGKGTASLNRLEITDSPVSDSKFLWTNALPRIKNKAVKIVITVGVDFKNKITPCPFIFTYKDSEVVSVSPGESIKDNIELIKEAAALNFNLLYPMYGIDCTENLTQDRELARLMGKAQTAKVLRNIAYRVAEYDEYNNTNDWEKITDVIEKLFSIKLNRPRLSSNGQIMLTYIDGALPISIDVSLLGSGVRQVLLLLLYLYWKKKSIILLEEPEAHIEILRRNSIYSLIDKISSENSCNLIITQTSSDSNNRGNIVALTRK